jgi:putative polyhydroxyalkanoate system protein
MNTLKFSIPHQLGREEARRRIQGHLGQLRTRSAGLVSQFDERWSGDSMNFTAVVIASPVSGKLQVEEQVVQVEVDLPWLLAALAGSVQQAIESNTRQLLEHRCPS